MSYVAAKGGEQAIANAHALLAKRRRGDPAVAELDVRQIREQLSHAVDRVMSEGSCYDRDLAALAIKQACGDLPEAIFLLRAYRTTLPRFGFSEPVDTAAMLLYRRISATFKDIPGGQMLGPTFDYTHRLMDFALAAEADGRPEAARHSVDDPSAPVPSIVSVLEREGLVPPPPPDPGGRPDPFDITRQTRAFPATRDQRLQTLSRGDEGFLLAMAYASQRGWGATHPFCAEIRVGEAQIEFTPPELGFAIVIGCAVVTECCTVNDFNGVRSDETPPAYSTGYGFSFGYAEKKAISMAIVDRALRARDLGEDVAHIVQDEEFVLEHCDSVESSGYIEHLKLPHYVDFQASLEMLRRLRADHPVGRDAARAAE